MPGAEITGQQYGHVTTSKSFTKWARCTSKNDKDPNNPDTTLSCTLRDKFDAEQLNTSMQLMEMKNIVNYHGSKSQLSGSTPGQRRNETAIMSELQQVTEVVDLLVMDPRTHPRRWTDGTCPVFDITNEPLNSAIPIGECMGLQSYNVDLGIKSNSILLGSTTVAKTSAKLCRA